MLAVLRVPTKEAWDLIPFKELIKRALGFVRERWEGEKEKKYQLRLFFLLGGYRAVDISSDPVTPGSAQGRKGACGD